MMDPRRQEAYHAYFFYLIPGKDTPKEYSIGEKVIYAYSEVDARRQFKETFKVDAGTLTKRTSW